MTHTDIDRGKDRVKETKKVIVIVVSVVVTAENHKKIYRRFISVPLVYAFDQRMGGERLRVAGRLGLS